MEPKKQLTPHQEYSRHVQRLICWYVGIFSLILVLIGLWEGK